VSGAPSADREQTECRKAYFRSYPPRSDAFQGVSRGRPARAPGWTAHTAPVGRPPVRCARSALKPASVRSRICSRSNSASDAKIGTIKLPPKVVVSSCSGRLRQPTPRFENVWIVSTRCGSERPSWSSLLTTNSRPIDTTERRAQPRPLAFCVAGLCDQGYCAGTACPLLTSPLFSNARTTLFTAPHSPSSLASSSATSLAIAASSAHSIAAIRGTATAL
jgi:hypothetical protein